METQAPTLKSYRCIHCHRLLMRANCIGIFEIKCPKCKTLNHFEQKESGYEVKVLVLAQL